MKKTLRAILQYLFFAALAAFFVWLSLKDLNGQKWLELKAALRRADYWILVPVLLLLLASHWLRALRWRQLMEPLGYQPKKVNVFLGVMIGYFVNLGAPRLGEVIKCTVLARYEKIPADKLVGTIVAERAFDMICLLAVFGLALIFQFDVIHSLMGGKLDLLFKNASGHASYEKIGAVIILVIACFSIVRFIFRKYGHTNIIQKIKAIVLNIWHGLTSVRALKNKPLFIIYSIGIWALYLFSTWFGFFAIRETSHLTVVDALSVLAMGSIGMIVSPGGIGAYTLLVMKTVEFYNIPADPYGQALGWLLWLGQFLSFIIFGVASFILLPRINRTPHYEIVEHESTPDHPAKNI